MVLERTRAAVLFARLDGLGLHQSHMSGRNIIVIGASAGGVPALRTLFQGVKVDLAASLFVVLHIPAQRVSLLPDVLQTQTPLPVESAVDGETIEPGRVYVAPPDRHLIIEPGHLHLSAAPKENRARPAINPLFRSAALAYGPRVIGIILSGTLDDGTAGLWEIKRRGGVAIVQVPEDAEHGQMPSSAIANVEVDYSVPVAEIGALLSSLVSQSLDLPNTDVEHVMSERTSFTCPDCHGPIQRFKFDTLTEYRCRVGHIYSPEAMLEAHEDAEERSLWSAIEALEEGADLTDELCAHKPSSNGLQASAQTKRALAKTIRHAVETAKLKH
jgi:two-component system, chemotaxis family, protein-glutamate methylesterase/glutaminase